MDIDNSDEVKTILSVLQKSEGFIKKELASMVRMPQMPKLNFEFDKGTAASVRINEILKNLVIPEADDDTHDPE